MSPTLILFFSLSILMALIIASIVLLPWLKNSGKNNTNTKGNISNNNGTDNKPDESKVVIDTSTDFNSDNDIMMSVNVATFKERLSELKQDVADGMIDESHYQSQKTELERQLIEAQSPEQKSSQKNGKVALKSRVILLIWIPVLTVLVYLMVGDRSLVFAFWSDTDRVGQVADELLTGKINSPPEWAIKTTKDSQILVTAMQANVQLNAHDANRWMRLSELFLSMKATDEALKAMERANRLEPNNDEIATAYVKVSYFANGEMMTKKATRVLQNLLATQPDHEGAIMLMVMGETRAGNHTKAMAWVDRLRNSIKKKSGDHTKALASLETLTKSIKNNQRQAKQNAIAAKASAIEVKVTVSDEMKGKIQPKDVLFITVRDVAGGAPYAVKKLPISSLSSGELTVSLSDNDAMIPSRTISTGVESDTKLVVNARISHSGQAISESGDLAAETVALLPNEKANDKVNDKANSKAVKLVINQIVP